MLHRLAQALLDHETIDGNEVEMICKGGTLEDLKRDRAARDRDMAKEQEQARAAAAEEEAAAAEAQKKISQSDPMGNPAPAT